MDTYRPELWHDFFLLAGTASGALAGLVFVAITLHLRAITARLGHRHRARTIVGSLGHILITSLIVLVPTLDHVGVGVSLVLASGWLLWETLKSTIGLVPVIRRWRTDRVARTLAIRTTLGDLSMVVGFVGAGGVLLGTGPGLSFVAADIVVRFALAVAGAWLLIVAVGEGPEVPAAS